MKKRYCAKAAFNGSNYCGYQIQDHQPSVQESIQQTLTTIYGEPISIVGCGRTDTGVHASEYYFHFDTTYSDPKTRLYNINGLLGDDIVVYSILEVEDDFHARFHASRRSYEYHIHTVKSPFLGGLSYFFKKGKGPLDTEQLIESASIISDYIDFKTFCKAHSDAKTTLCTIYESKWEIKNDIMIYHVTANRFLRGMVRMLVGAQLNVAKGQLSIKDLRSAIESGSNLPKPWSVPAHGLYLSKIVYPQES